MTTYFHLDWPLAIWIGHLAWLSVSAICIWLSGLVVWIYLDWPAGMAIWIVPGAGNLDWPPGLATWIGHLGGLTGLVTWTGLSGPGHLDWHLDWPSAAIRSHLEAFWGYPGP